MHIKNSKNSLEECQRSSHAIAKLSGNIINVVRIVSSRIADRLEDQNRCVALTMSEGDK